MNRGGRISTLVLIAIATGFGVSSTIQAYWLERLSGEGVRGGSALQLLGLNLIYWYVPALAGPAIMAIATRFQLGRARWPAQVLVHAAGAATYAIVHSAVMTAARIVMVPDGPIAMGCWSCALSSSLNQLDWLIVTYLFFVGVAHAAAYRQESEQRALVAAQLETRLVESQLQALQRQLHPHFLFNTLQAIAGLMRTNVNAADRMIDQLGDLLRMTLVTAGRQLVSLREELDAVQKYLEIEQVRFGRRLCVSTEIDPGTLDALIPNLLLQPIVENAIRHGIAPNARAGELVIRAVRTGTQLRMSISDNGSGVAPDRLDSLNNGVGLSNPRARLERLYRSDFQFTFSNRPEGGLLVTMVIPFQEEPAAEPLLEASAS